MQRLLIFVLLLIFGLPTIAPVLGLGSGDAGVPACCRRAGAHHCMGGMQGQTGVVWRAPRCAAYPSAVVSERGGSVGLAVEAMRISDLVSQPTVVARAMARARVAREKARGMRGPPVLS